MSGNDNLAFLSGEYLLLRAQTIRRQLVRCEAKVPGLRYGPVPPGLMCSPIPQFVEECCLVGVGRRVRIVDLMEAVSRWCRDNSRTPPPTLQQLGKDIGIVLPGVKVRRNNKTGRFYDGLALKVGGGGGALLDEVKTSKGPIPDSAP